MKPRRFVKLLGQYFKRKLVRINTTELKKVLEIIRQKNEEIVVQTEEPQMTNFKLLDRFKQEMTGMINLSMIRFTLVLFICLGFTAESLKANKVNLDSLKQQLSIVKSDTELLKIYEPLVKGLAFKAPDSALSYGFKGLEIAKKENDTIIIASLTLNVGTAYYAKGDYDNALRFWKAAAEWSEQTHEQSIKPLALNNVAIIYQNTGDIDRAIETFFEVLKIQESRRDTIRIGRCTFNIGKAYLTLGKDSTGLIYLNRSVEIYKSLGSKAFKNLGNAFNELGTVQYNNGNFLKAVDLYQDAINYYELARDTIGTITPKGNICNIYRYLKDYVEAERILLDIINIKEKSKQFSIHFNYHNLGGIYNESNQLDSAKVWLNKALKMRMKAGLDGYAGSTAVQLAKVFQKQNEIDSTGYYYKLAIELIQQTDDMDMKTKCICAYGTWQLEQGEEYEAMQTLNQCYQLAEEINSKHLTAVAAEGLKELYRAQGNYKKAFYYLDEAWSLKDSLFNADLIREVTHMEASFSHEKEILIKQNEIQQLENEQRIDRLKITLLIVGMILLVISAIVISWGLLMRKERKKRELEEISRFKQLMTDTIVHDLKNPLNVIINLAGSSLVRQSGKQMLNMVMNILDVHKYEEKSMILDKFVQSLYELSNNAIREVEFLTLQKKISIVNEISKDIQVDADQEIMIRVLVNFLTNAIKYSPENGTVRLIAEDKKGMIQVKVIDNGPGVPDAFKDKVFDKFAQAEMKKSGSTPSTGIGLTFCKMGIEAHGGEAGVENNIGPGSTFWFTIPLADAQESSKKMISETERVENVLENSTFQFSEEIKQKLINPVQELEKLDVFYISKIKDPLASIEKEGGLQLQNWVEEMNASLEQCNNDSYHKLLNELRMKLN